LASGEPFILRVEHRSTDGERPGMCKNGGPGPADDRVAMGDISVKTMFRQAACFIN